MGLFNKIKNMFKKEEIQEEIKENLPVLEKQEDKIEIEEDYIPNKEENKNIENDKEIAVKLDSPVIEKHIDVERVIDYVHQEEKLKKVEKVEQDKSSDKDSVKVYEKGLTKSREGFISKLAQLTNKYAKITEEYFDELEEILIMADIGIHTVMNFMDRLRERVRQEKIEKPEDLKELIVDELFIIYVNEEVLVNKIQVAKNGPTVLLFVGVNGVGKTTTIGKLAWKYVEQGKKVLLVAGDTFRAGATKQLEEWSIKVGASFVGKEEGADPAAVVFDGLEKAVKENYDFVFIDTAGRLQNKVNLMNELEKINRVIARQIPEAPHETLLIIDATTGQNGISQAKSFKEITNITGIVLTKLDGTAKGGIVLAIKEEVGLPVKYIGLGERKEDLQVFDIEKYIYGLFKDMM